MSEERPKRKNQTWKLLAIWLTVVLGYGGYMASLGYSPSAIVQNSVEWLRDNPMGPLVYVIAFLTRSITLIPASGLSVVAGYCYGAGRGFALAMGAGLLAGLMVFSLGRRLGGGAAPPPDDEDLSRLAVYREKLRSNGFTTCVTLRWMMLPYDPCSYLCGSIRLSWGTFVVATLIGNLPGTLTCALFGAGIHGQFNGQRPDMARIYELCGACLLGVVLMLLVNRFRRKTGD